MISQTVSSAPAIRLDSSSIPFHRLINVETRKFFDTLVGQVLTDVTIVLTVGIMIGYAWFMEPTVQGVIMISGAVLSILLPAMGILAVTSEWSHGTASTTFALEPRRVRIVASKLFPPVIATALTCAVLVGVAFVITGAVSAARGVTADWTFDPAATAGWFSVNVILVLSGVALGTLILNAPAAIIFVATSAMAWSLIAVSSKTGAAIAAWFDIGTTTTPLLDGRVTNDDLVRITVSIGVWVLLPLILGAVRVVRREVR
ncbi:hypothetical protein [Frigoribacterium sp. CG_9.8]|uniref:hypothetical protein n=1 Tax=Frigoribacterium sp. CG_9.8 TaxID=2787733 RepID=UPI0018CB3695|nr:hypothetical protein [Frigoribacterium sp. CG_9.8]MBG6107026.1 ABC-type transport system involved in multi-copper enzyme maturation permease subunit [Frigoribacterium sp. CG_9.8]